jgi:hypothetical protein
MKHPHDDRIPYGIFELHPQLVTDPGPPFRVRCCVRGCNRFLIPPSRTYPGEVCREHGIRTHRSATYSYVRPERNIITARDVAIRIANHPFKWECRFQLEKSEDAAVFNLLRSFMEAGCLNYLGRYITGLNTEKEPRLFLWGIEQDEELTPFDLLIAGRERFERRLPVERPMTEPDAMLYLPGRYLALIEAKLTSPNPVYTDGPRRDSQSLTKEELIGIYDDPLCLMIDIEKARRAEAIAYQMFRNVQFASWMAHHATPGTRPYFANLTRRGYENDSFNAFTQLVRPEFLGQVTHIFWEDLWVIAGLAGGRLCLLQEYLMRKTSNLLPAFDFRLW